MSEDNGKIIGDEKQEEKPSIIEMRIVVEEGKAPMVYFPMLEDKVITYGFLKMAEKVLDAHYAAESQPKIIKPNGGIMNFVRGKN